MNLTATCYQARLFGYALEDVRADRLVFKRPKLRGFQRVHIKTDWDDARAFRELVFPTLRIEISYNAKWTGEQWA